MSNSDDLFRNAEKLYYFAYGSNLCEERLRMSIPSLKFECIGTLKNFELVFCGPQSRRWCGSAANIKLKYDHAVMGAVWRIKSSDLAQLDKQEGVHANIYKRLYVDVVSLETNKIIKCLTYQKCDNNEELGLPSPAYKNVILNGAKKLNMPKDYIAYLRSFEDNGYDGEIGIKIDKALLESS